MHTLTSIASVHKPLALIVSCHPDDLLRQHKAEKSVLSERPLNRSRNTSNISHQSHETRSFSGPRLRNPCRQPSDPPRGVLAQADAGFARFLKEHASPKHQRVTAGGRIVPMDRQEPPPQMKLLINEKHRDKLSPSVEGKGKSKMKDKQAESVDVSRHTSDHSAPARTGGVLTSHARLSSISSKLDSQTTNSQPIPNLQTTLLNPTTSLRSNAARTFGSHQVSEGTQPVQESYAPGPFDQIIYQLGGYPLVWFPSIQALNSQGAIPSFMPSISQLQSSSLGTPSEFTSTSSLFGGIPSTLGQSSSIPDLFVSTPGLHEYQSITNHVITPNQPLFSTAPFLEASLWKSLNQVTTDYASLSTQLTGLDRYMAMHTWDLDPRAKRSLVEQRKSLVRELDVVRSYKEQLETTLGVSNSSGVQKGTNPSLSGPSNTRFPGGFVANEYFSGLSASSMQHTASGYPPSMPVSSLAQHSSPSQSLNLGLKWQANQVMEAFGGSHPATPSLCNNWDDPRRYNQSSDAGLNSIKSIRISAANSTGPAIGENGWMPSSVAAPLEIREVYNRIEDATRKDKPIDDLLRELSQVTTQLMMHNRHNLDGQTHRTISLLGKQMNSFEGARKSLSTDLVHDTGVHGPVAGHCRRPWASEHLAQKPSIRFRGTSLNSEEDFDSESTASLVSTTDSWATVRSEG
ncbi:uncharacterized protein ACLA_014580 [Aspergillus clavatus NRRL 1]|uniref:Uncharacterized protein n=1 Tax=Aspergillus clavatus (strain ATCC 1007 / CBS 513.65 / DSM 816 / NCTC 3887 / NRRL 1 / QM 1276 / 107) TaxID=344612 RepID=A1CBA3_ASPCL|nr:uncharacterized protein ACLA_014580 [Aspergillus clavatus NRRL 1]EAW13021.1 conserved hypothetical protein [Aspergillus clavatus NRRL 1]